MSENNALAGAPILDAVLLLYGIPVPRDDAFTLLTMLLTNGDDLAVSAAKKIYKGIDEKLDGVPLTAGERDAILAVLEEPPPSRALAKLRAMLVSDRAQRLAQ